jgi:hypothetical protein
LRNVSPSVVLATGQARRLQRAHGAPDVLRVDRHDHTVLGGYFLRAYVFVRQFGDDFVGFLLGELAMKFTRSLQPLTINVTASSKAAGRKLVIFTVQVTEFVDALGCLAQALDEQLRSEHGIGQFPWIFFELIHLDALA